MSASIAEDGHARHRDKTEICDLCGAEADGSSELCVFITCSRHANEGDNMYHQNCLEKYLKKHGFQYNRKTGFPCPRGRGKGTKFSDECKGKVDKSHPVIPKNEEKKKKAAAPPLAEVMAKQPKKGPEPKEKKPALAAGGGGRKNNPAKSFSALASSSSTAYKPPAPRPPVVPRVNAWQDGAAQQAVRAAPPVNLFAALDPPAAAAADVEEVAPRLPVGLVLMDEAVSRAQKKNLQRRKKKQAAMDAISEAPTDASVDQASSLDDWPAEQQAAGAAAGGDGTGAGPSSGSASTAALLNGSHFVTDIRRYQQLLGMTFDDSSDEGDDAADGEGGDYITSDDAASALTASVPGSPPAGAVAAASPPSPVPAATATAFQGQGNATAAAFVGDEDAALQAAIEASERQYRLEQEQAQQRAILAGAPAGMYGSYATDAGLRQDQQPAPQVLVPVATPAQVVPVALPAPVPHKPLAQVPAAAPVYNVAAHGASHGFNFAQPQPQQATAQFGGGGYQHLVWQQAQVPQQQKFAGYGSDNGYGGGYGAGNTGVGGYGAAPAAYGGAPAMVAAGHGLAPAPGGDDDDDLSSLLELCGVAG